MKENSFRRIYPEALFELSRRLFIANLLTLRLDMTGPSVGILVGGSVMSSKQPNKSTNILATFERKWVAENFQKLPNLVTLVGGNPNRR